MLFNRSLLITLSSASACFAAALPSDLIEERQNTQAAGSIVIRTDLKQDNSYDLATGQNCSYKYNYLSITGSTVDLIPFKSRSQATVFGTVQPEGIPISGGNSSPATGGAGNSSSSSAGLWINIDTKTAVPGGYYAYAASVGPKATGKNYFYTLPNFGNEIKVQKTTPSWDTWLVCNSSVTKNGKLGLYWLGVSGSTVFIPFPQCAAVRLYADDASSTFTVPDAAKKACPAQLS